MATARRGRRGEQEKGQPDCERSHQNLQVTTPSDNPWSRGKNDSEWAFTAEARAAYRTYLLEDRDDVHSIGGGAAIGVTSDSGVHLGLGYNRIAARTVTTITNPGGDESRTTTAAYRSSAIDMDLGADRAWGPVVFRGAFSLGVVFSDVRGTEETTRVAARELATSKSYLSVGFTVAVWLRVTDLIYVGPDFRGALSGAGPEGGPVADLGIGAGVRF